MTPAKTSGAAAARPRIGIPWRTTKEERGKVRQKLDYYFEAARKAGAEPTEISLQQGPEQLQKQLRKLDAFILPGSPADVDPGRYGASKHPKTNELDANRDTTDIAILDHALRASKPVLAICYGCQLLNVYFNGSLIQDIRAERPQSGPHGSTDLPPGAIKGDVRHQAAFLPGSRLATLNEATAAEINSSHHQAIDKVGHDLQVTARASDGTVEGVEWTGGRNWLVGVQWHPERMPADPFSERLFADFVAAARVSRGSVAQKV
jgi:putative glutamine amidotransferase